MATSAKTTAWKLPVVIGLLFIVAILINVFFFIQGRARREAKAEQQSQQVALAQAKQAEKDAEAKRVQDATEEHDRFLTRYLNSGLARKPGVAIIAVAVESETGKMNPSVATALVQRFGADDFQLLNSFFKPEFVADKYVASIFSGDTGIFDRLELTNWLQAVIFGRQTISYSTNSSLGNTVTADMRLQVMEFPLALTRESQSWALSSSGVGFNELDARLMAEDRIIHQIATDLTMTLTNSSTKK